MGFSWVNATICSLPCNAVLGGKDVDGSDIYVGRARHNGCLLPAKIIPRKNAAYVCYDGREIQLNCFEVLVGCGLVWKAACGGFLPCGAISAGSARCGETLYVGRFNHCGSLTVGRFQPSRKCAYIPFGGQEVSNCNYEVLCQA